MIEYLLHTFILSPHFCSSQNLNPCYLLISRAKHTDGMQIHSPGFCCNPGRRPINTKQRRGDPRLNAGDLDHKFTNLSVPLTLRMAGPRSREVQNPPYAQMTGLPEGWGCGWQHCWCQGGRRRRRLKLGVWIGMGGGVKAGREVSVGQLKVLMGVLREQNHSHRWLRSLYLVAKNEGNRTQL